MHVVRGFLLIIVVSVSSVVATAQDTDTLALKSESLLTYEDSLSIFRLIDSLMMLEDMTSSQLAVRLFYNSNVLWAGRTLGIDQFGLAPGLSYYHKSGLYADASAYWSQDFEPNYYLTILSAGYLHSFSSRYSAILSYDHYFYNLENEYIPFSNGLTASQFLDVKPVTFRLDYTFYFGKETAHRIMPSVSLNLRKNKFLKIDRVSFTPSVFMLMGNETITEIIFPSTAQEWIQAYIRMRQGMPWYTIKSREVFGIMNYSFLAPINVSHNNWSFSLSYAYNIPRALPGETLLLDNSGFLTASFTYFIDLKRTKSPL